MPIWRVMWLQSPGVPFATRASTVSCRMRFTRCMAPSSSARHSCNGGADRRNADQRKDVAVPRVLGSVACTPAVARGTSCRASGGQQSRCNAPPPARGA
jgi:hypothetical protein